MREEPDMAAGIVNEIMDEEERHELPGDDGKLTKDAEGHDEHCDMGNTALESDLTTPTGWCGKISASAYHVLSNIRLEPMLFLKMVAESNFKVVADTLELERICLVNLGYSKDECDHMDTDHSDVQAAVQRYQNTFNYYQTLMDCLLPLAVILFFGGLSDSRGRKLPMVFVLGGFVGLALLYLLMSLNPHWPVEVLLGATFVVDITGSWVVFNMAVYSYMADITTPETRTKRMGFVDAVWYLGSPIGMLLGGWMFRYLGFASVFITSAVLWTVCFLYTLFIIPESRSPEQRLTYQEHQNSTGDGRFGPLGYVVSLFRTIVREREEFSRWHIIALLALKLGVFFTQGHTMLLWARRVLKWDPTEYSTWSSIDSVVHQVGMVLWVWVASHFLLHDCHVAAGGLFSMMLWSVVLAFVQSGRDWWLVIVATFVGMLEPSIEPAIRSQLTVVTGEGEEGRVLAFLGVLESSWFLVDGSLYTFLYNTYLETFPQINFVVQAGISLVLAVCVLLLKVSLQRRSTNFIVESGEGTYTQHHHQS
ncbi:putative peptidoglycan muropeptide transporter SLC46 isoform X2 [Oratosquilla oratoria]